MQATSRLLPAIVGVLLGIGLVLLIGWRLVMPVVGQSAPTATPLPLRFPTQAPFESAEDAEPTAVPTFTPTPLGPAVLRLREGSGAVNIRAEPDPDAELIGQINEGDEYVVTGRYFLWYQIRYDDVRSGVGYVFGQLVEIVGNPDEEIPDLTIATPTPPLDPAILAPTETAAAILALPDGELTLTAMVREIEAPEGDPLDLDMTQRQVLPTFTFPPDVVAQAPTLNPTVALESTPEQGGITIDVSDGVAPVLPMLVLAGLGVLFFLLGMLQRGN